MLVLGHFSFPLQIIFTIIILLNDNLSQAKNNERISSTNCILGQPHEKN